MRKVILNCVNLIDPTLQIWAMKNGLHLLNFSSMHDFDVNGNGKKEVENDVDAECVICRISSNSVDLNLSNELIKSRDWGSIPVIFLVENESVNFAVKLMKKGAWHVFGDMSVVRCQRLFQEINSALDFSRSQIKKHANVIAFSERHDNLTCRERQVMSLISKGLLNKQIADELKISSRTVEIHRSRVFKKLNVKSAIDLVNSSSEVDLML